MNKRLLSGAMSALLVAGMCACATALTSLIAHSVSAQQAEASTYKFTEGNIQFTVPAGWDVKAEKGTVTVSPKTGGGQITLSSVPDAIGLNSDERERLLNSMAEKKSADLKLGVYGDNETVNGLRYSFRPFTGKDGGREVNGMYMLLGVLDKDAPVDKYVFISASSAQGAGESVEKGMDAILHSFKRLE